MQPALAFLSELLQLLKALQHPSSLFLNLLQNMCSFAIPAEAVEGQEGSYEWGPKGLKPFDLPAPTAGGDVAAVKAGHVSISALNTGFIQPKM